MKIEWMVVCLRIDTQMCCILRRKKKKNERTAKRWTLCNQMESLWTTNQFFSMCSMRQKRYCEHFVSVALSNHSNKKKNVIVWRSGDEFELVTLFWFFFFLISFALAKLCNFNLFDFLLFKEEEEEEEQNWKGECNSINRDIWTGFLYFKNYVKQQ